MDERNNRQQGVRRGLPQYGAVHCRFRSGDSERDDFVPSLNVYAINRGSKGFDDGAPFVIFRTLQQLVTGQVHLLLRCQPEGAGAH